MSFSASRKIKGTGLYVSPLGLGTVKFGRSAGLKYPITFALPTDEMIVQLLQTAKTLGINLIDTAPAYGSSEKRIGQLLDNRAEWLISTKVGESFTAGRSRYDFSASAILKNIEQSLKHLNTDWLDIVLIHSDGNDVTILQNDETVKTLSDLKSEGLIKAIGLSGKTVIGGISALRDFDMDIAMVTHNPIYQAEQAVIDYANQQQKSIFIKKAFASGHLKSLGAAYQADPITQTMCFQFASAITSVIIGTINPEHLKQNYQAVLNALGTSTTPSYVQPQP